MKLDTIKKKYPKFVFEKYLYEISGKNLEIFFDFRIEPDIRFRPKITVRNAGKNLPKTLDNLVFNLGLIEMLSYWKATCSPVIEIKAGYLSKEQIRWWQTLIEKGMGQFFFENRMKFQKPKFIVRGKGKAHPVVFPVKNRALVPVGGGKDSALTLELMKKAKTGFSCFSLNPTDNAKKIMKRAGCKIIVAERKIDKRLLLLNQRGFLNGHTPFSAYLGFLSVLLAGLFGFKYVVLSNERSSEEGNVKYLGRTINHQWSKSFDFERKFRKYSKKYLAAGVEYFSLLRPLYEIQIARLFSKYPGYFPLFLSCNEAYKTASGTKKPKKVWCGRCSKCLFAFAILYPFLKEKEMLKIFKNNLFENKNLLPIMQELIGERGFKPLECVGTKEESLVAFYLSWKKSRLKPVLLKYFEKKVLPKHRNLDKVSKRLLSSFGGNNSLPKQFKNPIHLSRKE